MKKFLTILTIATTLLVTTPAIDNTTANAQYVYRCVASSATATGVGFSPSLYTARRIALIECSRRTPYGLYCFIDYCD